MIFIPDKLKNEILSDGKLKRWGNSNESTTAFFLTSVTTVIQKTQLKMVAVPHPYNTDVTQGHINCVIFLGSYANTDITEMQK